MADELRSVGFGYIPDDEIVNIHVIMNETVSHAGDFLPFNLRELLSDLLWNLLGRLSHDLDASHEGPLPHLVTDEILKGDLGDLSRQKFGLLENVAQKLKRRGQHSGRSAGSGEISAGSTSHPSQGRWASGRGPPE